MIWGPRDHDWRLDSLQSRSTILLRSLGWNLGMGLNWGFRNNNRSLESLRDGPLVLLGLSGFVVLPICCHWSVHIFCLKVWGAMIA